LKQIWVKQEDLDSEQTQPSGLAPKSSTTLSKGV